MDLVSKWKTTNKPEGPTGLKRKGTFRDVSLTHYIPEFVDDVDYVCLQLSLKRSEVMDKLNKLSKYEPLLLLPGQMDTESEVNQKPPLSPLPYPPSH